MGTRTLNFKDGANPISYTQTDDDLKPFVEPLLKSAKQNAEHFVEGHDLRIVGEIVALSANVSSGLGSGVLVLTDERLVYLRTKKGETYIDRESNRNAITNVKLEKSMGTRTLNFKDGANAISYTQSDDDLKPFVEPLWKNAQPNARRREEGQRRPESRSGPKASNERDDEGIYDGHDITKVGEPALLVAKASSGWRSGVLVLTETRLVYLRKKKNETIIDRATSRSDVTEFDSEPMNGDTALRFKDDGSYVIYINHGDDFDSFVEPLQASSDANQLMREAEQREAKQRKREQWRRAAEKRKARLADLEYIVGEPMLLSRTVVEGLLVLTEKRLLLLDTQREDPAVVTETNVSEITDVKLSKFFGTLEIKVGTKSIIYSKLDADLKDIADALQGSIDANEGIIYVASGSNGQVYLYEDHVSITRNGFGAIMTSMARREKDIMLRDISSVELRKSGVLNPGFIRFGHSGGPEPRRAIGLVPFDAISNDTNAVTFNSEQQDRFEILRRKIERQRSDIRPIQAMSPSQTPLLSPMDELKKLAELKEMGIVTEEEFEQKKKQLLGL